MFQKLHYFRICESERRFSEMSKTFTSRPAVSRTGRGSTNSRSQDSGVVNRTNANRGRGRGMMASGLGRGSSVPMTTGRGETARDPSISSGNLDSQEQQQLGQRMSYQGGYTMISPNEKKKQQIQQQAERGMQSYQQHKEQNRIGHMSYVGTAGGGQMSQEESRRKLVEENRNPSMRLREKREEYRVKQKQKEEEEINQKRLKQRQLAEKNELRKTQNEEDKRKKWDEERRRQNEAFLNKLEGKGSKDHTPPQHRVPPSHMSSADLDRPAPSMSDSPLSIRGLGQPRGVPSDIDTLHDHFPNCDRTVLEDILSQAGSVESAISMLS